MKKLFLFTISGILLSFNSCSKSSGEDEREPDPLVFFGSVTFYITKTPGCDNVQVFLQKEDLTKTWEGGIAKTSLTAGTATCGMATGYTFTNIPYGKYKFNTNCGIRHLNGTITVNKDCTSQNLD